MVHYHDDYLWGKAEENYTYPILKAYFKTDLKQYPNQYDDFDFYDDKTEYEQKSRKFNYNKYDETMISLNKTMKQSANGKDIILIFNFTDGIYWIKYDEQLFNTFRRESFSRAGYDWDKKDHIYIPIKYLKLVKEKSTINPALIAMMNKAKSNTIRAC
jgi:hypothetical protein